MPSTPQSRFRRYQSVGLTLVAGLAISGGLGWKLHREAVELDQKRLALRIKEITAHLDGRLEKTELLLRVLQDYLSLSGEIRNAVFLNWCNKQNLAVNHPWVYGIAVFTNRHAASWRENFPLKFSQWTETDWAALQELALHRPVECQLALRSLQRGKTFLVDYGLKGTLQESNHFIKAIKFDDVRMRRRRSVMLGRNREELTGCVFIVPVYDRAMEQLLSRTALADTDRRAAIRWLHLKSIIVAPVNFNVLERALWGKVAPDLGVELFSSKNQTADTWLNPSPGGPRAADPRFNPYLSHRLVWLMYADRFSIFFYTTPIFDAQSPRQLARTIAIAGASITLLATGLVAISSRARQRQEQLTREVVEARDALAAAEKERERLGHDLHDGAIQSLYGIQLGLTRTSQDVQASVPSAARVLNETRERVDEVISELRRFIVVREAEKGTDAAVQLDDVLTSMIARLQPTTSAELNFQADSGVAARLSVAQALQLTQIARTALGNCLRHARARRVEMCLRNGGDFIRLEIADDGVGFTQDQSGKGGVGLQAMRARATEAGGTLVVDSHPGAGTRIIITIPSPGPQPSAAPPLAN